MHNAKQVTAMKYAFVTNRAERALSCLRAGRPLPAEGTDSLELAAKFLLEMRRGTALVVGSQEQLGYSAESIPAATRALGIIERLSLASRVSDVQRLLETFEANLRTLAQTQSPSIATKDFDKLELFIQALSQSLTEEVSQASLGSALEKSEHVGY